MSSQPNGPGGHDSGSGDDSRAREGYHDPTAGIAGAAPARSALTLRLVLAAFGFIVCSIGAALAVTVVNAPVSLLSWPSWRRWRWPTSSW